MTATQAKLLWAGGAILVAWLFGDKDGPATGTVELGVPTVNGVYNGIYWSAHVDNAGEPLPSPTATPDNPAVDPTMRRLIDQSNAAITASEETP